MSTDKISQLKALWRQAFGDPEPFIDSFFESVYSPRRCRVLERDGKIVSALYWFDAYIGEEKWAYLYAVATDLSCRRQGCCRILLEDAHDHLQNSGYAGTVLVPADGLWSFYEKRGYAPFGGIREFTASAGDVPEPIERIGADAYRALRERFLPQRGLDQSSAFPFYGLWGGFYRGEGFLFAAALEKDTLYIQEFFGDEGRLPGILCALGAKTGRVRALGGNAPCGMYLSLRRSAEAPGYLGVALD